MREATVGFFPLRNTWAPCLKPGPTVTVFGDKVDFLAFLRPGFFSQLALASVTASHIVEIIHNGMRVKGRSCAVKTENTMTVPFTGQTGHTKLMYDSDDSPPNPLALQSHFVWTPWTDLWYRSIYFCF
jgi:hypothetical protein